MPTIKCSFCGKPQNEVKNIIAADPDDGPFICNRCIERAAKEISLGKKTEKEAEKETRLPKPAEVFEHLKQYVIGQDQAARDVAIAVYNHYKRRQMKGLSVGQDPVEVEKSNILLLGPSGSGKTHLLRSLARMLNVPFHVGDATKLTQAGYVGDDVETLLQGLLLDAQGDIEKAQWGIIFLDEIDKISRSGGRDRAGYRDVSGEGVQQALLKLLEGSKIQVPRGGGKSGMVTTYDVIDTTNILFVCAGAFAGIDEIVNKRLNVGNGPRLGFGVEHVKRVKRNLSESYSEVTEDDVMDYGIIPEMMGRLPIITSTIELTEDQMVEVLVRPKNSIIKQVQSLFLMDGITLEFSEESLRAIAKEAKKRPTGARALRSIVEKLLKPFSFDSPSNPDIERIYITEDTITTGQAVITLREEVGKSAPSVDVA